MITVVVDPPETHGSDSLTSEVQLNWRRRKIGRPGKAQEAMGTSLSDIVQLFEVCKNRRACGVSLWSERKTESPLGVAAVAMKQKNQEVILGILVRSRRGACQRGLPRYSPVRVRKNSTIDWICSVGKVRPS